MYSRPFLLFVLFLAGLPGVLSASPCAVGTLQDYYSLSGGCTIGGATFSDFRAFATPNGSLPIDSSLIAVTPIISATDPGFLFAIGGSAAAGEFFDVAFGFQVTANSIDAINAIMTGTSFTNDGSVTTLESYCLNNPFGADQTVCAGTLDSFLLIDSDPFSQLSNGATFGSVTTLGIVKDIGIDGALAGSASVRGVSDQFHITETAVVPEPATIALFVTGVGALAARRRLFRNN